MTDFDTTQATLPPLPRPFLSGVRDCIGVPAMGLGLTMVGFGAMAQDAGLGLLPSVGITGLVWGIAGQVALIEIHSGGGGLIAVFIAVALANLRMLPMTVTGLSAVTGGRRLPLPIRLALMHLLAITAWVQIVTRAEHVPAQQRATYYTGFAIMLISTGIVGTTVGHEMGRIVPAPVLTVTIFMTPLYLLLLVGGARQWINRLSVIFGVAIGTSLYPTLGDWAVVASGLVGGSLAFLISPRLFPVSEDAS